MHIQEQVKLGPSVAFEVVMQGIRIRLGRSVITLMGVLLGIAFLMSMLTGEVLRTGVSREDALRAESARMYSFLLAEVGPVRGRTLAVLQTGSLNDQEQRFVTKLLDEGAARLAWAGAAGVPAGIAGHKAYEETTPAKLIVPGVLSLVVLGDGAPAAADWAQITGSGAPLPVTAFTRRLAAELPGVGGTVSLDRELRPDEIQRAAAEKRASTFRSLWIVVISLLVTVIGISNAMLMSVTERFREIGTMKCLGSLSSFIRQIFLIESSLMGLVGAVGGALIGFVFSFVAYMLTYGFGLVVGAMRPGMLLLDALIAITAGIVLSIVAAIYPAWIASRMVPAAALRSNI